MPFVPVPKDLSKVKTKVALNLTKRQLICFSAAAAIGVPAYLFSRETLGNEGAMLLMIGLMLPLFFLAMYEKDGQPAEKILRNILRTRLWPEGRPYRTRNLYEIIEKEGKDLACQDQTTDAAQKASAAKKPPEAQTRNSKKARSKAVR
ncbi:MAG: PrgI family protein [Clostridiales bacterium]|uniref:PrgI family protein n=1 Tax=Oxobacter pfennigii TaxID=36849 RepID=UPI0006D415EA|nr:PrgI family protein [Oxobacter pfennigii]